MDIGTLATGMRTRMPWEVGKLILNRIGLPKGHGWDNTVAKLSELKTEQGELAVSQLHEALQEHTICGEKLTAMYKVNAPEKAKLRKTLLDQSVPQGKFAKAYPGVLTSDILADAAIDKLHLVAVIEGGEGLAAVFTSVRYIEVRETMLPSSLGTKAAEVLSGYHEIIGIKQIRTQPMDVIWIPSDGDYVDIRVDHRPHVPEVIGRAACKSLRDHIDVMCGAKYLTSPVNFFPLIQRIYGTEGEGRVVEMAFGTTTASLKHERMRRKQLCLRQEAYHKGGKKALNTPLELYRLSVQWDIAVDGGNSTPEVSFNGVSRMAASADMPEIVVSGCVGISDYSAVRKKIEGYLKKAAPK